MFVAFLSRPADLLQHQDRPLCKNVTFDPTDVDRGLMDRLNSINNTLTTQWNRLQNIRNTVDDTGAQADRARSRVRDAENLIDRARHELDKAKDALSKVVSEVVSSWRPTQKLVKAF